LEGGGKYFGLYKYGERNGQGSWTKADGTIEEGIWKNGELIVRNGQASFTYEDGGTYYGGWLENKRDGEGTMNFTATSKENKKEKRGLFVKYVGGWSNDKLDGHGTMEYANGRIYVGEWKKGKRHGQGTLSYPDGGVRKGIWSANKLKKQQ